MCVHVGARGVRMTHSEEDVHLRRTHIAMRFDGCTRKREDIAWNPPAIRSLHRTPGDGNTRLSGVMRSHGDAVAPAAHVGAWAGRRVAIASRMLCRWR